MKQEKQTLYCWENKVSDKMTLQSGVTEEGIFTFIRTKVNCFHVYENGDLSIHLKRESAAALANILVKALSEEPKEEQ